MKSCSNCKFGIFEDHGYSNYTVEGTYFHCAKDAHPEDGFDRFYGIDERLQFAEKCPQFSEGESIHMDVDNECEEELSPDQKKVWDEWKSK